MFEENDIKIEFEDEESKIATANMIKDAPSPEIMKNYGRWLLYAIKAEITLNELRGCLYWQSILEVGLMAVAFFLLLIESRFIILLHVLHFQNNLAETICMTVN